MNDKNKSEKSKEPIDAEFETLDEAVTSANTASKPKSRRGLLVFGIIGLAIILVPALWFFVFNGAATPKPQDNSAKLSALSRQVDTMRAKLTALHSAGETQNTNLDSRLQALENAPAPTENMLDEQALGDLKNRVTALESATSPSETDASILAAITQRLDQIEAQIIVGKADAGNTGLDTDVMQNLLSRISALENASPANITDQALPALRGRLDALDNDIADIRSQLNALETQTPDSSNTAALALGLLALDSAAQSGAPFEQEWQTLSQLLPQNPDVQVLAPLARTGVPGLMTLRRDFARNISIIRNAAGKSANKKPGMMDKAKAALGTLVSLRRVDGNAKGVDAILLDAQAALDGEDLQGAVTALGGLDNGAHAAAQSWLTQAQARLTLTQSLTRLKAIRTEVNP